MFYFIHLLFNFKNTDRAYGVRLFETLLEYVPQIFRQKLIDNLLLASFCGSDIINDVNRLERKDSTYFNRTYEYMRVIAHQVNEIRESAKALGDNELKQIKKILQRNPLLGTPNLLNFEK